MSSMYLKKAIVILLFGALFLGGCYNEVSYTPAGSEFRYYPLHNKEVIGYSVQGRPIEMFKLGEGRELVFIIATIHGNESAGTPLVYELMDYLKRDTERLYGKQLLIVPVANPDGYAAGTRGNIHGVDLNRNFPAGNRVDNSRNGNGGLGEPESRALYNMINMYRPERIVSIHQPLACIDYDGPADWLASAMARECDLPVKKLGSRPGSLGSWAGVDKQIPIVTLELLKADSGLSDAELWDKYGRALLAVL